MSTTKKTTSAKKAVEVKKTASTTTAASKATTYAPVNELPKQDSKKEEVPQKTLAEKLRDIEVTRRAAKAKSDAEKEKQIQIGRSKEPERRVSSATKIAGLRGLNPRLGQQFSK